MTFTALQDGDLESYYDLEDYLSYRGYRDGFYGLCEYAGLDKVYDDETDVIFGLD